MRTTRRPQPRIDFLHPAWSGAVVALAAAWVAIAGGGDWTSPAWRAASRLAGYVAFAAMLIPYLHIVRRAFRSRRGTGMTTWLRWHIGAAYVALLMVLIHSRGRAASPATVALLWLTWIVMISGVVGYYGQKLLYFLMPRIVPREFGLERLDVERQRLCDQAATVASGKDMAGAAGIVAEFCQAATADLDRPLRFAVADAFRSRDGERSLLSENGLERARSFADEKQRAALDALWGFVETRRSMDAEYRLHQLGRLWLYVHGPAAWALLVVMIEHVVSSWWYGGF